MTSTPIGKKQTMGPETPAATRALTLLYLCVFLVGLHSLGLGIYIYFFTAGFYDLAYSAEVENFFFVRQAGLFLGCLGLFYWLVLWDMRRYRYLVVLIVVTKILAVVFMLSNAHHTSAPGIVKLASLGDGAMAGLLLCLYVICRVKGAF